LFHFLSNTKIGDISSLKDQKLIIFSSTSPIKDVYETMSENGILSAPVMDDKLKKCVGMVDMRDCVGYALALFSGNSPLIFTANMISDFSGMNPFVPIDSQESALGALRCFHLKEVHRMPIVEEDESIVKLLTQSVFVQWINEHRDKLGEFQNLSVEEAKLGGLGGMSNLLLSVTVDEPVHKAFTLMNNFNVHGVPVLDSDGKLYGNISLTDFKFIMKWDLSYLNTKSKEFLDELKIGQIHLVTCTNSSTVGELLQKFVENKVHRVYLVDQQMKPTDIISLTDIIDTLYKVAVGNV